MASCIPKYTFFSTIAFIFFSLLCSVLGDEMMLGQFILFTLFKCDGAATCVVDEPAKSFSVESQTQCILECKWQKPEPCVGVNYRQLNNICDMFFNVTDFTDFKKRETGCQYIQVDVDACVALIRYVGIPPHFQ